MDAFDRVRDALAPTVLESRLDSAFFSQNTLTLMDHCTISVPFERFFKDQIETRQRWRYLDEHCSYFESDWKPESWPACYRFLFVRRAVPRQTKQALQLDLFEPRHIDHEYRVVVTNKMNSPRSVLLFHYGRGAQEGIFAEAKQQAGLDLIPTRRLLGNQMVTLCAMMAHNLGREMQMLAQADRYSVANGRRRGPWNVIASFNAPGASLRRVDPAELPKVEKAVAFPRNPLASNRFMQRWATSAALLTAYPIAVSNFLKSPWAGREREALRQEQFHAVTLVGNGPRIVVRHWMQATLETAKTCGAGSAISIWSRYACPPAKKRCRH